MGIDSATVIIRSVGERTESLCEKLIIEQGVPRSNIFIVRVAPFSAAMKKSFEIGFEHELPWTFCVDADVLLRDNAINRMVDVANKQRDNVCEIQGLVLDKFFGGARHGGPHLYRTSLLPHVLKTIPAEGENIRPETHALNTMKSLGFPWLSVTLLTGLHDFEQYNRDIFRKSIVQAHKHLNWMEVFIPFWRRMAKNDYDYFVALAGIASGIMNAGQVFINAEQPIYRELFTNASIEEKEELNINKYSLSEIENIIDSWQEPGEYLNKYSNVCKLDLNSVKVMNKKGSIGVMKGKLKEFGFFKLIPWLFGRILRKSGNFLCNLIEG